MTPVFFCRYLIKKRDESDGPIVEYFLFFKRVFLTINFNVKKNQKYLTDPQGETEVFLHVSAFCGVVLAILLSCSESSYALSGTYCTLSLLSHMFWESAAHCPKLESGPLKQQLLLLLLLLFPLLFFLTVSHRVQLSTEKPTDT